MRTLAAPPKHVVAPLTGALSAGAFRGGLPPVDFAPLRQGRLFRLLHHKRWVYAAIATDELFLGFAVVHLGYVASAFVFAYEKGRRGLSVDRSSLGPPLVAHVADMAEEGCEARFELGKTRVRIERRQGSTAYDLDASAPDLVVAARLETVGAPPPISVVAPLGLRAVNATQKRALLGVTGTATVRGRTCSLDRALAGIDFTSGLLARHTAWRWAFALGRDRAGRPIGCNLVEGFVGEPECAAWIGGELHPLAEGRFEHDPERPEEPWRVRTADGRVDLRFLPGGVHAERRNLGLVSSCFVQPAGVFDGTIEIEGLAPAVLEGVLGVVEDQDVLW